jgi:hypothetical protein
MTLFPLPETPVRVPDVKVNAYRITAQAANRWKTTDFPQKALDRQIWRHFRDFSESLENEA